MVFLSRFHGHRQTRVGRLSGGVVVWVARHGCRASAAGPGMALRRVPTPRHRSEGTPAGQGLTPAQRFWSAPKNKSAQTKVTRPSGRNQTQQRKNAVVATRFKAQALISSQMSPYQARTSNARPRWRCIRHTAFATVVTSDCSYRNLCSGPDKPGQSKQRYQNSSCAENATVRGSPR